jgi:HSP20 family protein
MSKDEDHEDAGTGIESIFSEMFGMMEGTLLDVASRSLQPLFNIGVTDDTVTVTFDLPGARRDEVAITCTEDTISVDAEMARPVKMRVSSGRHERQEFVKYSKKVLLPVMVEPEKGSAKFKNGIVVVKLPRRREGRSVKLGADPAPRRLRQ